MQDILASLNANSTALTVPMRIFTDNSDELAEPLAQFATRALLYNGGAGLPNMIVSLLEKDGSEEFDPLGSASRRLRAY